MVHINHDMNTRPATCNIQALFAYVSGETVLVSSRDFYKVS